MDWVIRGEKQNKKEGRTMERDETLCTCKMIEGKFDDLNNHAVTCPYRLKYDEIVLSADFNEKELMGLHFICTFFKDKILGEKATAIDGFDEASKKLAQLVSLLAQVKTNKVKLTEEMFQTKEG